MPIKESHNFLVTEEKYPKYCCCKVDFVSNEFY